MASSFRIKLKLSGNNSANNKTGPANSASNKQQLQQPSSPNSTQENSPTRSISAFDDASLISEEGGEEEEIDELEDSPPPADERTSRSQSGKVRKLSGAAAMKAANSLKRSKMGSGARTPVSDGEASSSRVGSLEGSPTPSTASGSRKRSTIVAETGKTIDEMSMAEIEALPAAKRRKGMKLRGAAGPGRGWRKGLKMDMKPIYRPAPTDSPPSTIAPGTPSSFSQQRPKSALGRDALSKANTPMRSESPFDDDTSSLGDGSRTMEDISGSMSNMKSNPTSRAFPASHAAVAARKARAAAGANAANNVEIVRREGSSHGITPIPTSNPAPTKQTISTLQEEGRAIKAIIRGGPTVLPPPKIPIGFVAPTPLDTKTNATILVRKWQRKGREILSLGGRAWSAMSWLNEEANKFPTSAEMKASATNEKNSTNNAAVVASASTIAGGTNTPAGLGTKSAMMTGNVTPNNPSRAVSPNEVGSTTVESRTSPSNTKKPLAQPVQNLSSSPNSPTINVTSPLPAVKSTGNQQNSTLSASDWKGSSAAFTAANRSRM